MFKYDYVLENSEDFCFSFSSSYNQSFFSAVINNNTGKQTSLNFYLNTFTELPDNVLIYDYLGSGEMYHNANDSDTVYISVSKSVLNDLYNMACDTHSLSSVHADLPMLKNFSVSKIASRMQEIELNFTWANCNGFDHPVLLILIDSIFNSEKNSDQNSSSSASNAFPLVCSYLTFSTNRVNHISNSYEFANIINNYPSCSHQNFQGKFVPCKYFGDFQNCSLHQPKFDTVTRVSVNHKNTDTSTVFSVRKFYHLDSRHSYAIYNDTKMSNVFTLNIPEEIEEEKVNNYLSDLLNKVINTYEEDESHDITSDNLDFSLSQPFIASVLN